MRRFLGVAFLSAAFFSGAAAQSLNLDDFTIKANGTADLILVKKDGKISVEGTVIGALRKSGELLDLKGKTIAEIDKTGKIMIGNKPLGTINREGEFDNGTGRKAVWTQAGEFAISDFAFFTVSPNDKKYYQTAAFLVLVYSSVNEPKIESPTSSIDDEELAKRYKYRDSDLVASIARSPGRSFEERGYSIKIYGDGRITQAGETVNAKSVPLDKKSRQAKINRFLKKAEEMNFAAIYEKNRATPKPFVHDGISVSTGAWINGGFREVICGPGGGFCSEEVSDLHKFFVQLFAEEIGTR